MIFPVVREPYEDLLDDLQACYGWIKQHTMRLKPLYNCVERLLNRRKVQRLVQAFNPRRHHWRLIFLLALLAAAGLILAEFIPEGAPAQGNRLLVFSVYTGLETVGMLLGYKLFRKFLGILKN